MALSFKHKFNAAKADGTDVSLLRPSNWNDEHAITLATGTVIGRQSAGVGAAEEITLTAFMTTLLAAIDGNALASLIGLHTTGDGKLTLKNIADTGWLLMDDGTFGNAGSGASNRANADTSALFTLLYNNVLDANAPILTSAGVATTRAAQGTATAAFASLCRMTLPRQLGRAITGAGTGAGLTARPLGSAFGADTINLSLGQLPTGITSVNAAQAITTDVGAGRTIVIGGGAVSNGLALAGSTGGPFPYNVSGFGSRAQAITTNNSIGVTSNNTGAQAAGGATPTPLAQASVAWNVMVKL
jgi:hypothetical protein